MVALLHGTNPPHPIYGSWTYAKMANEQGIKAPKIHMLCGNRLMQFKGSAADFKALSDATSTSLYEIYKKNPYYFVEPKVTISSKEEFIDYHSKPLRDFNSVGVVCAHFGGLISTMKQKYYTVYSEEAKVNAEKIKECTKAIDEIIVNL